MARMMLEYETMIGKLVVIKKRLRMELELIRSTCLSEDEALLAKADERTHRRLIFIQRLPTRVLMLVAAGVFFYFFATENEVGLMLMIFLLMPVIVPIASLAGIYVTIKAESHHVNVRREYARLVQARLEGRITATGGKPWRMSIADRAFERRSRYFGKVDVPGLRTGRPTYAR